MGRGRRRKSLLLMLGVMPTGSRLLAFHEIHDIDTERATNYPIKHITYEAYLGRHELAILRPFASNSF